MRYFVFGGANVDINVTVPSGLVLHDSNIGKISFSYGGVGRNIAENLARLGCEVFFVSVFSSDEISQAMFNSLASLGIRLQFCKITNKPQSSYLNVIDDNNDLYFGLASMESYELLTKSDVHNIPFRPDDIFIIDTNFNESVLEFLFDQDNRKIVDAISSAKAIKLKPFLDKIYMLKVTPLEGEALTGEKDPLKICKALRNAGVKSVIVSLGEQGLLYQDPSGLYKVTHKVITPVNTNGAGDALLAGFAAKLDCVFDEQLQWGIASSFASLQSSSATSKKLNQEFVRSTDLELKIEEIEND